MPKASTGAARSKEFDIIDEDLECAERALQRALECVARVPYVGERILGMKKKNPYWCNTVEVVGENPNSLRADTVEQLAAIKKRIHAMRVPFKNEK